jgi:hypothetical protein
MVHTYRYDQTVAEELNKIGKDLECERYPHERNDEYGLRLIADVEDDIDRLEALLVELDNLRARIVALL